MSSATMTVLFCSLFLAFLATSSIIHGQILAIEGSISEPGAEQCSACYSVFDQGKQSPENVVLNDAPPSTNTLSSLNQWSIVTGASSISFSLPTAMVPVALELTPKSGCCTQIPFSLELTGNNGGSDITLRSISSFSFLTGERAFFGLCDANKLRPYESYTLSISGAVGGTIEIDQVELHYQLCQGSVFGGQLIYGIIPTRVRKDELVRVYSSNLPTLQSVTAQNVVPDTSISLRSQQSDGISFNYTTQAMLELPDIFLNINADDSFVLPRALHAGPSDGGVIFAIVPSSVVPTQSVTIYGQDLLSGSSSIAALTLAALDDDGIERYYDNDVTFANDTLIKFNVNATLPPNVYDIAVLADNGFVYKQYQILQVGSAPVITSVTPAVANAFTPITVRGTDLFAGGADVSSVTLDNVGPDGSTISTQSAIVQVNDTMLVFAINPLTQPGTHSVIVTADNQVTYGQQNALTIVALFPTITSVVPEIATPGSTITITGTNFAAEKVVFEGTEFEILSSDGIKVVARVPPSVSYTAHTGKVRLYNPGNVFDAKPFYIMAILSVTPPQPVPGDTVDVHIANLDLFLTNDEMAVTSATVAGPTADQVLVSTSDTDTVILELSQANFTETELRIEFINGMSTSLHLDVLGAIFKHIKPAHGVPNLRVNITGTFEKVPGLTADGVIMADMEAAAIVLNEDGFLSVIAGNITTPSNTRQGPVSIRLSPDAPDANTISSLLFTYVQPVITGSSATQVAWPGAVVELTGTDIAFPDEGVPYSVSYGGVTLPVVSVSSSVIGVEITTKVELAEFLPNEERAFTLVWDNEVSVASFPAPEFINRPTFLYATPTTVLPDGVIFLVVESIPTDPGVSVEVSFGTLSATVLQQTGEGLQVRVPTNANTFTKDGRVKNQKITIKIGGIQLDEVISVDVLPQVRVTGFSPAVAVHGVPVTLTGTSLVEAALDPTSVTVNGIHAETTFNTKGQPVVVFPNILPTSPSVTSPSANSGDGAGDEIEFGFEAGASSSVLDLVSQTSRTASIEIKVHAKQLVESAANIESTLSDIPYVNTAVISAVEPSQFESSSPSTVTIRLPPGVLALNPQNPAATVVGVTVGTTMPLTVTSATPTRITATAAFKGSVGPPGSGTDLMVHLASGVRLSVSVDACRCGTVRTATGVKWPSVIGCGSYSQTPCAGLGITPGAVARRMCLEGNTFSAITNTSACENTELRQLSRRPITPKNAETVMREFANFTRNAPLFAPKDVESCFGIIRNVTSLIGQENVTRSVGALILRTASDLFNVESSVLTEAAEVDGVAVAAIPSLVEKWGDAFVDELSGDRGTVQREDNLVLVALRFNSGRTSYRGTANRVNENCDQDCDLGDVDQPQSEGSVVTSQNVPYGVNAPDIEGIIVTLFRDSRLFAGSAVINSVTNSTVDGDVLKNSSFVDSPVISIQTRPVLSGQGTVEFTLPIDFFGVGVALDERSCSFWNVPESPDEEGMWSVEGCRPTEITATNVTCECDHTTNFAVLANFDTGDDSGEQVENSADSLALSIITYVGITLSCMGLLITFIVFISYEVLRNDTGRIIIMHLCATLFIALVIFAFGIEETDNNSTCTTVAYMLHFFLLSAVMWMLVEGYHLYNTFVTVFSKTIRSVRKEHIRFALFAYGAAAITVLISGLAVGDEGYGTKDVCWLDAGTGAIWAFWGPLFVAIAINIVFFILILRSILSIGVLNNDKVMRQKFLRGIRASGAFMAVMGLGWIFGALMFTNSLAMQYLFAICNSFQGVFIFLFHCYWNAVVRDTITGKTKRDTVAYMRSKSTKYTDESSQSHSQGRVNSIAQGRSGVYAARGSAMAATLSSLSTATPGNTESTMSETNHDSYMRIASTDIDAVSNKSSSGSENEQGMGDAEVLVQLNDESDNETQKDVLGSSVTDAEDESSSQNKNQDEASGTSNDDEEVVLLPGESQSIE